MKKVLWRLANQGVDKVWHKYLQLCMMPFDEVVCCSTVLSHSYSLTLTITGSLSHRGLVEWDFGLLALGRLGMVYCVMKQSTARLCHATRKMHSPELLKATYVYENTTYHTMRINQVIRNRPLGYEGMCPKSQGLCSSRSKWTTWTSTRWDESAVTGGRRRACSLGPLYSCLSRS